MSTHAHSEHGGYETEDFKGTYAIWAVPFSLALLFAFVFIVVLWVPAAASKEMKTKDIMGAETSRAPLIDHRGQEAGALEAGEGRLSIEESMAAVVRENSAR
jgi:membrane protein implicated in regulation of membrane protease activity